MGIPGHFARLGPGGDGSYILIDLLALRKINKVVIVTFGLNQSHRPRAYTIYAGTDSIQLTKSRFYYQYFQNLVIASDNYGDFLTRLIIGDAIRTKFTSLTFDKARFNGVRWY